MPQFAKAPLRPNPTDVLAAIALFSIGLFKKVVIADGIAEFVTPAFGAAASGQAVSLLPAWSGALAYTFQIYFDFSGYSDMALGLARIFGVRLPMNFNSPLRASSIIEFWGRWHITLTRFLTAYIYTPIVLSWTRRRLMRRKPVLAGSRTKVPAFAVLVAVPTLLTMAVSGLWHGAGLQFILWGLIHGLLLIINQGWRILRPRIWSDQASYDRFANPVGFVLTFLSVVLTMVFFRADSVRTAMRILKGMVGANGVSLPYTIGARLGAAGEWLKSLGVTFEWIGGNDFVVVWIWIIVCFAIVTLFPNSLQLTAKMQPALDFEPESPASAATARRRWPQVPLRLAVALDWRWATLLALLFVGGTLGLGRVSEFLYWQF